MAEPHAFILGWIKRGKCEKIHYSGKLKEYKNFFSRPVYIKYSRSQLIVFDDKNITFLMVYGGHLSPSLKKRRMVRVFFLHLLFLKYL